MSYCPLVYNQTYKPKAESSSAGLNVRHLQYIATRPGAVYNQGCGFGLWGQLPGEGGIRIQTDLERAKQIVREASRDHTLYRAYLSVGKEDAEKFGFYHRERWEQLVNDHIQVIAKENDIKPENFCWCASMHYAKGHPHTHIIFWDNGTEPRSEYIQEDIFEKKMERIRAEFAGDIHREEIRELQQEQRSQLKELRTSIQAMCREVNPEKALNLPRLYRSGCLTSLSEHLDELLRQLPTKGCLRYSYLPPDYKKLLDSLIDRCLQVPELAKELESYDKSTREISQLYAKGKIGAADAVTKAREKLRKELGNEVMEAVRVLRAELEADRPEDLLQARSYIHEAVTHVMSTLDSYGDLKKLAPDEGAPLPGYYDALNEVVKDVLSDARVRLRLQAYALESAGIDLASKPDAPRKKPGSENEAPPADTRYFRGKIISDEEWTAYRSAYRDVKKLLQEAVNLELLGDIRTSLYGSPDIRDKICIFAQDMVAQIVPELDSYKVLKELLPAERIPVKRMEYQIPGYHEALNKVVGDVLWDARVRMRLQTYALELAGIDLEDCDYAPAQGETPGGDHHVLYGKVLTDEQWQSYQDIYREAKREIRRSITNMVRQDAGWTAEAAQTNTAMLVCGMLRLLSQATHQRQAVTAQARRNSKNRSKDKSREAMRDRRATQNYASEWDDGYN